MITNKPKTMSAKTKKVFTSVTATFLLSEEDLERLSSKWVALFDEEGKEIASTDLSSDGYYEDEEGNECDEEGNSI